MGEVDPESIRDTIRKLVNDDGVRLVADDEVADVAVENDWIGVLLAKDGPSRDLLTRAYDCLRQAYPRTRFEIRTTNDVYRGGAGFGEGRSVVAVLGGKGGVGKSTVSINLALTLSAMGLRVGLLDADLNGPDIPHMLGVHPRSGHLGMDWRLSTPRLVPPLQRLKPYERYGIEVMSVGFVVPERLPLAVTGQALVSTLLRYLVFDVAWDAEVLILDAPPGTGEELQTMARRLPLSGAVFVTTPQDLAQMDAERTLGLLKDRGVPVIGLVHNMASLTCPHCDQTIDLFAESTRLVDAGVTVLGRIPFDVRLSTSADRGQPLILGDPRGPIAYEFARIGVAVRRWLLKIDKSQHGSVRDKLTPATETLTE